MAKDVVTEEARRLEGVLGTLARTMRERNLSKLPDDGRAVRIVADATSAIQRLWSDAGGAPKETDEDRKLAEVMTRLAQTLRNRKLGDLSNSQHSLVHTAAVANDVIIALVNAREDAVAEEAVLTQHIEASGIRTETRASVAARASYVIQKLVEKLHDATSLQPAGEYMTPDDKARLLAAVQDVGLVFPVQACLADRAVHTILHLRACVEAQNAKVRNYQRSVEGARARVTEVDEARAKVTQALQVFRVTMEDMGYVCDPNPDTTPAEALRVIRQLHEANESLRTLMRSCTAALDESTKSIERAKAETSRSVSAHTKTLAELEQMRGMLAAESNEHTRTSEALAAATAKPESPWPSQQGLYAAPKTALEEMALMAEDVLTAGGGSLTVRIDRVAFSLRMCSRDSSRTSDEEAAVLKSVLEGINCPTTPEAAEVILREFCAKHLPSKRTANPEPLTVVVPIDDMRQLVKELRACGEKAFEENPVWMAAYYLRRMRKDAENAQSSAKPQEIRVRYSAPDRSWLFDGTAEKLSGWPEEQRAVCGWYIGDGRHCIRPKGHEGDHAPKPVRAEALSVEGRKDDGAKLRYDLLDSSATAWLVAGMTYGAAKYAPNNWRKVEGWEWRYIGALLRHIEAYRAGEQMDPDSGGVLPHLALAMCSLHMLVGRLGYGDQAAAARAANAAVAHWRASVAKETP